MAQYSAQHMHGLQYHAAISHVLVRSVDRISCRTSTCDIVRSHVLVRYADQPNKRSISRARYCTVDPQYCAISCTRYCMCLFGIADQPNKHVQYRAHDIARLIRNKYRAISCARYVRLIFSSAVRSGKVG